MARRRRRPGRRYWPATPSRIKPACATPSAPTEHCRRRCPTCSRASSWPSTTSPRTRPRTAVRPRFTDVDRSGTGLVASIPARGTASPTSRRQRSAETVSSISRIRFVKDQPSSHTLLVPRLESTNNRAIDSPLGWGFALVHLHTKMQVGDPASTVPNPPGRRWTTTGGTHWHTEPEAAHAVTAPQLPTECFRDWSIPPTVTPKYLGACSVIRASQSDQRVDPSRGAFPLDGMPCQDTQGRAIRSGGVRRRTRTDANGSDDAVKPPHPASATAPPARRRGRRTRRRGHPSLSEAAAGRA
jgi:hypothetical protein